MRRIALAFVMAVVACGGATSNPGGPSSAPAPTPSPTPSPTETRAATRSFVDAVHASALATYRIVYVYRVVANGQTQTLESTWYVRPPEMRWDFASPLGGSSSFYVLKDGVYVCSASGQPSPGCFSLGSLGAAEQSSGVAVQELVRDHPERFAATPGTKREIAGIAADCFTVNDVDAVFGVGTLCYSAEGLPLFTEFKGASAEFTMEAQSVTTNVTDADLKLPGPVQKQP